MVKAWCVWCESGDKPSSSGYYWMHMDCAMKMMDIASDVESIKQMLEGEHARSRFERDGQSKIEIIYDFIKDMEKFRKQWEGTMKVYHNLGIVQHKLKNKSSPVEVQK